MKIGHDSKFVQFEITESGDPLATCYWVHIQNECFAGSVDSVWIGHDDARNFIEQLGLLEQNLVYAVDLRNFSYGSKADPLKFMIHKVDPLGHLGVFATVAEVEFIRGKTELLKTSICFEMDREFLGVVIRDFKKLFSR